jgi:hypothetical protein
MGFPQIIVLLILTLGTILLLKKEGEPRSSVEANAVGLMLAHLVYFWGGFYDVLAGPQLTSTPSGLRSCFICTGRARSPASGSGPPSLTPW